MWIEFPSRGSEEGAAAETIAFTYRVACKSLKSRETVMVARSSAALC